MRLAPTCALALATSYLGFLPTAVLAQKEPASGPFGLRMGMTAAEVRELPGVSQRDPDYRPLVFEVEQVPKPHDAFEGYLLIVSEKVGLCKIVGLGETIGVKPEGKELQTAFREMEEAIGKKYGRHLTRDDLDPSSRLRGRDQWMAALHGKDRRLTAFWDEEERSELKDDIMAIVLDARTLSEKEGFLRLGYSFKNWTRCEEEGKQARRKASADAL